MYMKVLCPDIVLLMFCIQIRVGIVSIFTGSYVERRVKKYTKKC